jgi:iron complex outermembrane receptor protein
MNRILKNRVGALLSLVAAGLVPIVSYGQASGSSTGTDSNVVRLDKFEVTGSYIPYSAEAPAVPVRVVSGTDIEATGQTADLLEVIRKAVPQFVGNGNLGSSNSNIGGGSTNGGSQLLLRNVATLVLINGRRAAFSPVSATGGYTFVDVNSIPVSAVERIEVLKDGASALYGSDAVSGVVNIILKKDYQGFEVGGRYAFARNAGRTWEERAANVIVGAKAGKTSVTVSAEWVKSDPLFQNEREFSADQTGKTSSFAGVVNYYGAVSGNYLLAEGKSPPPVGTHMTPDQLVAAGYYTKPTVPLSSLFNLSQYVTLALGNEKRAFTAAISHQLADNVELFGDMLYSHTDTFYQLAAQPIVGMPIFAKNTENFGVLPFAYTNPDHPQNPFDDYVLVRNRFVDNPRQYYSDNDSFRGLIGARGDINDHLSWEVALNLNKVNQMFRNVNVINRVNLANALDNNQVNLFARVQDPVKLQQANIFGTAYSKNESTLNSFDARVNGDVFDLPAGTVKFAVGGEERRETMSGAPDAGSYTILDTNSALYGSPALWDGATTSDNFGSTRKVDSIFGELRIPIIEPKQSIRGAYRIDLDLAGRYDKYSDTDDPFVPKASLRWFPFSDSLAIRAAYSESFSAASLYSLFGPTGVGFSEQPIGLKFVDGRVMDDNVDQAFLRVLSNPNLKPETAKNYNAGIVWSPKGVRGLSVEVNYFQIKQDQIAGSVSDLTILQDVETNGAQSKYADRVRINGFNGDKITAPGQISAAFDLAGGSMTRVFETNFSENFVSAMQDGADVTVDYKFDLAAKGRFDVTFNGLWYNRFRVENEDYVGTTNGRSVLNGGTIPRWRGNLQVEYTKGDFMAGTVIDYIPSVTDTGADPASTDVTSDPHVESFTTVDGYVGYRFVGGDGFRRYLDGLRVRVGVTNIFNEKPPMSAASWTDANADTATYTPFGRVYYVSASLKF